MEQIPSNKVATATQRQRLQELFDRALRLKHGSAAERDAARELFRHCFVADPGNLIYAQSWLSAIDESETASSPNPIKKFFLSRAARKARARGIWSRVIDLASRRLAGDRRNVKLLADLAEACTALGHDSVAVLLLRRAAETDDRHAMTFRQLALALEKVGDLAEARRCWHSVGKLCPDDDEAAARLTALGQKADAGGGPPSEPHEIGSAQTEPPQSVDQCLRQVDELAARGRFAEADECLRRAISLLGNDIGLQERAEQLLLDQVQYEVAVAESRLEENSTAENQSLLDGLRDELNRREIDFYATRSQRYPNQRQLKFELGLRLKRAGIYAEAIAEFVDLLDDEKHGGAASVETGECWQSLRQFDRALNFYRDAVKKCPDGHECFQRSRYRAAVLLEAMGNLQQAESLLEEVVRSAPDYKDAASRLDKIRKTRHIL